MQVFLRYATVMFKPTAQESSTRFDTNIPLVEGKACISVDQRCANSSLKPPRPELSCTQCSCFGETIPLAGVLEERDVVT